MGLLTLCDMNVRLRALQSPTPPLVYEQKTQQQILGSCKFLEMSKCDFTKRRRRHIIILFIVESLVIAVGVPCVKVSSGRLVVVTAFCAKCQIIVLGSCGWMED